MSRKVTKVDHNGKPYSLDVKNTDMSRKVTKVDHNGKPYSLQSLAREARELHALWRTGPAAGITMGAPGKKRGNEGGDVWEGKDFVQESKKHKAKMAWRKNMRQRKRFAAIEKKKNKAFSFVYPEAESWQPCAEAMSGWEGPDGKDTMDDVPAKFRLTEEEKQEQVSLGLHRIACETVLEFLGSSSEDQDSGEDLFYDSDGEAQNPLVIISAQDNTKSREDQAFDFFMQLFEENQDLQKLYKEQCNVGKFECLVCSSIPGKPVKRYNGLVSVVMHASKILNTKKRQDHRGYARAVCCVLGWDPLRNPTAPNRNLHPRGCLPAPDSDEEGSHDDLWKLSRHFFMHSQEQIVSDKTGIGSEGEDVNGVGLEGDKHQEEEHPQDDDDEDDGVEGMSTAFQEKNVFIKNPDCVKNADFVNDSKVKDGDGLFLESEACQDDGEVKEESTTFQVKNDSNKNPINVIDPKIEDDGEVEEASTDLQQKKALDKNPDEVIDSKVEDDGEIKKTTTVHETNALKNYPDDVIESKLEDMNEEGHNEDDEAMEALPMDEGEVKEGSTAFQEKNVSNKNPINVTDPKVEDEGEVEEVSMAFQGKDALDKNPDEIVVKEESIFLEETNASEDPDDVLDSKLEDNGNERGHDDDDETEETSSMDGKHDEDEQSQDEAVKALTT